MQSPYLSLFCVFVKKNDGKIKIITLCRNVCRNYFFAIAQHIYAYPETLKYESYTNIHCILQTDIKVAQVNFVDWKALANCQNYSRDFREMYLSTDTGELKFDDTQVEFASMLEFRKEKGYKVL